MDKLTHFLTPDGLFAFVLLLFPAVFGIICHEVAHGLAAYKQGDPTAKFLGRLTLNPLPHIDPAGLAVFVFTALFSPFAIGWAKPVPIQPRYFKHPREGMVLVAIAGPLANFLVALTCLAVAQGIRMAFGNSHSPMAALFFETAITGAITNCSLAWFNLMPIPPLDGSHILEYFLPRPLAEAYSQIGRYGMFLLLLLLASRTLNPVLSFLVQGSMDALRVVVGLV